MTGSILCLKVKKFDCKHLTTKQRIKIEKGLIDGESIARSIDKHPSTVAKEVKKYSSWKKGMLEKNHEYIRYVIPKGQSLDTYSQKDATVLMNHINGEARDSLNGCTRISCLSCS